MKPASHRKIPIKTRRVRIDGGPFAVVTEGDLSVVYWGTVPLYPIRRNDRLGRYTAAVDLVRLHGLSKSAVARALGLGRRTVYRLLDRFEAKGIGGLLGEKGCRKPSRIRGGVARKLLELKRQGVSDRQAATRLGLSASGVWAALRRLNPVDRQDDKSAPSSGGRGTAPEVGERLTPQDRTLPPAASVESESAALAMSAPVVIEQEADADPVADGGPVVEVSAESESAVLAMPTAVVLEQDAGVDPVANGNPGVEVSTSGHDPVPCLPDPLDVDPFNRRGDRLMARLGLLEDAVPMFASGLAVPQAGALLAVPLLVQSGVFDVAKRQYGTLGPAFYGLRTTVLVFILSALLRIKSVENLKESSPRDFGRVIGLDRVTEVKTLRRKLFELAMRGKGLEFMREMARLRVAKNEKVLGVLYVDGHVRVYSGHRHLPKTYVMQRRAALPATTDYWVHDMEGNPVFVVTAEANDGMTKMLPSILKEARSFIGDRRVTLAFDRGGWSPKLFRALINANCDILTYRKGKSRRVSLKLFTKRTATIDGRRVKYTLAETKVRLLNGKLTLRQIAVLRKNSRQTMILTNRKDLTDIEVAYRMFDRWRQENFFKYMLDEYALDALVDYGTEPADPTRTVPNPKRKKLEKRLKEARATLAEFERKYGAAAIENCETERRTMRGFKIAIGTKIGKPLREARARVEKLEVRRKKLPVRVTVAETLKGEAPVRLRTERKRLSDTFKMVAYQTESELVALLRPSYRRCKDEGRTLIANALRSPADLLVTEHELQVTLAPMSSPHKTRAIAAVCEQLNTLACCFPGTSLRLKFAVHQS